MKNQPFRNRLRFALNGWKTAWRGEASFRFQCLAAAGLLGALCLARPGPVWWGVLMLACAAVLAAELFNTALEKTLDALRPERHPQVQAAKDCAAGAVLVLSVAAVCLFVAFLLDR